MLVFLREVCHINHNNAGIVNNLHFDFMSIKNQTFYIYRKNRIDYRLYSTVSQASN